MRGCCGKRMARNFENLKATLMENNLLIVFK